MRKIINLIAITLLGTPQNEPSFWSANAEPTIMNRPNPTKSRTPRSRAPDSAARPAEPARPQLNIFIIYTYITLDSGTETPVQRTSCESTKFSVDVKFLYSLTCLESLFLKLNLFAITCNTFCKSQIDCKFRTFKNVFV